MKTALLRLGKIIINWNVFWIGFAVGIASGYAISVFIIIAGSPFK